MIQRPSAATLAAGEMENRFRDASDLVERYLTEGATRASGSAGAATLHLTFRSLADLRCGQYLVGEGFVVQMASVVRPVIESLNLIELFSRDAEAADRWAQGNDYREFMPARVRETLGEGPDPVYSWLSEVSHPRFAAFHMTTYQEVVRADEAVEDPVPVLHAYIGGLPHDIPPVLIATTFPTNVLCMLGLQLRHCPVKREVAWTWATVSRQIPEIVRAGYESVARVLEQKGGDEKMTRRMLERVDFVIQQARDMEEIAREERERQEKG